MNPKMNSKRILNIVKGKGNFEKMLCIVGHEFMVCSFPRNENSAICRSMAVNKTIRVLTTI